MPTPTLTVPLLLLAGLTSFLHTPCNLHVFWYYKANAQEGKESLFIWIVHYGDILYFALSKEINKQRLKRMYNMR